jgi:phage baseplate assembly protein W
MASIKIPFQFVNGKLDQTSSAEVAARQKIIDVLTTERFERVMRHNYGVGVRSLLFENVDDLLFADFKVDALQTLAEVLTTVEVLDLQIIGTPVTQYFADENTTVSINVVYRLPLGSPRTLAFNVAVPGSLNEDMLI